MDKEKLLIDLNFKVESIKAHINRLKRNELNIHVLDVDMLKKKTVEFYETIFELEKFVGENFNRGKGNILKEEDLVVEAVTVKPPVVEEVVKSDDDGSEIINKEVIKENTTEIITPKVIEEDVTVEEIVIPESVILQQPVVEQVSEPEVIPEPTAPKQPEEEKVKKTIKFDAVIKEDKPPITTESAKSAQTTYDLFSGNSEHAVAEKYQTKDEQSIADKMQKKHITNIREAIGINEKFLFINELFKGDLGRYNKILDDINELTTKQGVDTYLFELKIQFQWADDSEAYAKLKELLDRKFV